MLGKETFPALVFFWVGNYEVEDCLRWQEVELPSRPPQVAQLWDGHVEEWASQDERTYHRPELPGRVFFRNQGDQGHKANEGERLNGADEPFEQGLRVWGEEGVLKLACKTRQSKLDGKDVDGEDCDTRYLVIWLAESFMKGAEGKKASKESKAEDCGEEAEAEEEANTEPARDI